MGWVMLILGLALWTAAHLLRSVQPERRAALEARFGAGSKGIMALLILAGLGLMILGYRAAPFVPVWTPPEFLTHLNNLLMILAFYMYMTTATKPGTAFVFGNLKNPQLTGFKVWAAAHLLVNGDLAAIVLFGGLLGWAVAEVIAAKRVPGLVNRDTAPISSPWIHLGVVVVAFAAVAGIHVWLGVWPFG